MGYVTYFAHRNLGQRSEPTHFLLWFIQQKAALVLVEEKRLHNTQPNFSFLSFSDRTKSRAHFVRTYLQGFLNAINTNFKPYINNLSTTVHNKLPRHSKVHNIPALELSTWTKMHMTSFAPEEFLGGLNWYPSQDRYTKARFFFLHYMIRTALSLTQQPVEKLDINQRPRFFKDEKKTIMQTLKSCNLHWALNRCQVDLWRSHEE